MDELIYIIIKLLAEIFGGGANKPKGPGFPNLPPRPTSQPPPRIPDDARRRLEELQRRQRQQQPGRSPPGRRPQPPKPMSPRPIARPAPPRVVAPPPPPRVVQPAAAAAVATPITPSPPVKRASGVAVDAAALRRWLRPKTLRNQYMLSEIFQPPLALRESSIL